MTDPQPRPGRRDWRQGAPRAALPLALCLAAATLALAPLGCGKVKRPRGPLFGHKAPNLPDRIEFWVNGEEADLDDYAGRPILLYFWHPRDAKSLPTLPRVNDLAADFAPKGLLTIGLCVVDGPPDVEPIVAAYALKFRIAIDCDADLTRRYRIDKTGTPYVYLVNGQRIVAWEGPPEDLARDEIQKLLP